MNINGSLEWMKTNGIVHRLVDKEEDSLRVLIDDLKY